MVGVEKKKKYYKRYVDCTILERGSTGAGTSETAEDSSYDSDYDADESMSSSVVHPQVSSSTHSDVSRTTSDTLAAEFAEYVTVQSTLPSPQNPGYIARVEFALKLGYTERLVQVALEKLGPDPEQNELLAELIRLGASSSHFTDTPDDYDYPSESSPELLNDEYSKSSLSNSPSYGLRPVVIDGSNVAMSHGNKEIFSCRGIKICVDWFRARGHREITVFVPKWRKESSRPDNPIADQEILGELERDRLLVFTPSRFVGGKRMVCYDDRYILRLAAEIDGIVVSNDNYRDLSQENIEFRRVVEEKILMYSFVNDRFMPPDDPLGRSGPTLDNFLKIGDYKKNDFASLCPYAKKCTYGNKCKFRHPERGLYPQKTVTERLVEHAQRHLQARGPSLSLPIGAGCNSGHKPLSRTRSSAHTSGGQIPVVVPKSRSVENVTDGIIGPTVYQQISQGQGLQGYSGLVGWPPRATNTETEPVNMHRKLQRQLTLSPVCDPRLYQLRRYHQQQQQQQQQQQSNNSPHRPLTRHTSNENYPVSLKWDPTEGMHHNHQLVTRIASAPEASYIGWPPQMTNINVPQLHRQIRLGTSEPQLNQLPSPTIVNHHGNWNTVQTTQDARRRIHYHLSNIFPEEQVQTVMTIHPHETDPKKICATILAMFPKP